MSALKASVGEDSASTFQLLFGREKGMPVRLKWPRLLSEEFMSAVNSRSGIPVICDPKLHYVFKFCVAESRGSPHNIKI